MSKTYRIPVTYTMQGFYDIIADCFQDALEKALNGEAPYDSLPANPVYLDDSIEVDEELARKTNNAVCVVCKDELAQTKVYYGYEICNGCKDDIVLFSDILGGEEFKRIEETEEEDVFIKLDSNLLDLPNNEGLAICKGYARIIRGFLPDTLCVRV